MNYYLIAPIGLKSPLLTYQCDNVCQTNDICAITVRQKPYLGVVMCASKKPSFKCEKATLLTMCFSQTQHAIAQFIAQYYCAGYAESYSLLVPNFIESKELNTNVNPKSFKPKSIALNINFPLTALTAIQQEALNFIQSHSNTLLFGDTGSGKTEIYMHLIAQVLRQGKSALFLMPEIALTPQIEKRLRAVFGDLIGIWHSQITKVRKKQILERIQNGEVRVIAGARSALFLPLFDIGLIIIDEEHDEAYKSQNKSPHYNARDVALYLGGKCDIKVLLGSATPSVTSYFHAKANQRLFRLKGRHFGSKKHVHFVPLMDENINESIMAQLRTTKAKNEQSIVFLPTRAHYKMLVCASCGNGIECAFCSVNMSLHLDRNALICHYCHWSKPIPTVCPHCAKATLHSHRMGTAEVAKILQNELKDTNIALFDRDNITTHNKLKKTLSDFNDGDIDVLVGTQMLSKGHDYHMVSLAVVLGIDYILRSQDYRANERAISLLHQIAGRAGRKNDGAVYIQSANSAFLQQFMEDYEYFLDYELSSRPRIYPPFMRLCAIIIASKSESKAILALEQILSILKNVCVTQAQSATSRATQNQNVEIVGKARALLGRLYGKYRFVILLRSHSTQALLKLLWELNAHSDKHLQTLYEIDIDPINII